MEHSLRVYVAVAPYRHHDIGTTIRKIDQYQSHGPIEDYKHLTKRLRILLVAVKKVNQMFDQLTSNLINSTLSLKNSVRQNWVISIPSK